jgi:hypothetical protein
VSLDLKAAKRRLAIMGIVNGGAVGCGVPALYFYFRHGFVWGLAVFAGLMVLGIGVQIWFIASLVRARKGA